MSGLIVCRDRKVTHPYYVKEMGIHLYTGEELSYFIYHNILLINEEFVDERLLDFLLQLGYEKLADRVRRMKDQSGLFDILLLLLQELHYYNSAELFGFRRQLDNLSRSSYGMRLKAKGDYLYDCGQYYGAIRVYGQVLALEEPEAELRAAVWNNKGCCYARLEAFEEAFACLQKSYALSKNAGLLERLYVLSRLADISLPEDLDKLLTPAMKKQFEANFQDHRKLALYTGKALEVAALEDLPEKERNEACRNLLTRWKNEYRRNQA